MFFGEYLGLRWEWRRFLLCLLITVFVACNCKFYLDYQEDWFKQLSLIGHFSKSDVIKENEIFVVDDHAVHLNANGRIYRSSEFPGLFKMAFRDQVQRFAVNADEYTESRIGQWEFNLLTMKNYQFKKPQYRIVINPGPDAFLTQKRTLKVIKLMILEKLWPEQLETAVNKLVRVEYEKL